MNRKKTATETAPIAAALWQLLITGEYLIGGSPLPPSTYMLMRWVAHKLKNTDTPMHPKFYERLSDLETEDQYIPSEATAEQYEQIQAALIEAARLRAARPDRATSPENTET